MIGLFPPTRLFWERERGRPSTSPGHKRGGPRGRRVRWCPCSHLVARRPLPGPSASPANVSQKAESQRCLPEASGSKHAHVPQVKYIIAIL